MRKLPGLALVSSMFGSFLSAQAPPLGPEFQINTYTTGRQSRPSIGMDAGGAFVVVWQSASQDGSGNGVFGQRYDANGAPLGSEFQINSYTTNGQDGPSVAVDASSGRFVVVWQSGLEDGSGSGVFGQRFDSDGAQLGAEFPVNTFTSGHQTEADVAFDDAGNFIVVWQSALFGEDSTIQGRRFDAEGSPLGGEFQVNETPFPGSSYGGPKSPVVAAGASGHFVVAWIHNLYPWGKSVWTRSFDGSGEPLCLDTRVGATYSGSPGPGVAMSPSGDFVVAYFGDIPPGVRAQRMHTCSTVGPPLDVSHIANHDQASPDVAVDASGNFMVTWSSPLEGSSSGIYGRGFDADGPVGPEFAVNSYTTGEQTNAVVAMNGDGKAVLAWHSAGQDGSDSGVYGRRVQSEAAEALEVDGHSATLGGSNVNGVLEPDETVRIEPTWRNVLPSELELTGVASNLSGPPGPVYEITDAAASYGTLPPGETSNCADATNDCYEVSVSGARPADHWDAVFDETLSSGEVRSWTLHVGSSFGDVPTSHPFYEPVETMLHHGISEGCGAGSYCPGEAVRRDQMAAFLLKAVHGGLYVPPSCAGVFVDVPCPSPFADWIEQLYADGITGGCGASSYCPSNTVTRAQMAVFLLKAKYGIGYGPPACNHLFADVPCPGLFANWIERLFDEGITAGCGGGNYCPDAGASRGQMAAFVVRTFGLGLYGP